MPHHFENDLDLGQAAALRAMQYLNCPSDISSRTIFKVLSAPGEQDALRDLEPLLGVFVRHTNTCDVVVIKDDLAAMIFHSAMACCAARRVSAGSALGLWRSS